MKKFLFLFCFFFCIAWTIISMIDFLFFNLSGFAHWATTAAVIGYAVISFVKKIEEQDISKLLGLLAGAISCCIMFLLFIK